MKTIKSILATLLVLTFIPTAFAQTTFSDITEQELYPDAIQFLYSNQIVKGYDDGTFKPQNMINRAEMVKIIAEAELKYKGLSSDFLENYSGSNCFTDVPAHAWYTKYVCYGREQGWIIGYENGQYFRPGNTVTFVEGLKITFKGFDLNYVETSPVWYKGLVQTASVNNYIPFDIHSFTNGLKRNQMADLITRILKYDMGNFSLDTYLGNRKNIIVTYETIESGADLSKTSPQDSQEPIADTDPIVEPPVVINPVVDTPIIVQPPAVTNPSAPYVYFNYLSMNDTSFDITVYDGFSDGGKPIVSYNVYNQITGTDELFKVLYKEGNKEGIFTLNNLTKGAEYIFVIKAVNKDGLESKNGDLLAVTSGAETYYINKFAGFDKPEAPTLSITDQTSSYITLNFIAPVKGNIEHYAVEIRDGANYVPYKIIALSDFSNGKKDGPITFSGLTADKEYDIRITSVSSDRQWGKESLILKFIAQKNGYNLISKE